MRVQQNFSKITVSINTAANMHVVKSCIELITKRSFIQSRKKFPALESINYLLTL